MESLDEILNLSVEQKQIIRNRKENFGRSYEMFSELIDEMKETKTKLEKESGILEDLIENLRRLLNPTQCVKLITFI